jgi:hypothetical protein
MTKEDQEDKIEWRTLLKDGYPETEWSISGQLPRNVLVAYKENNRNRPIVKEATFIPQINKFLVKIDNIEIDIYDRLLSWAYVSE